MLDFFPNINEDAFKKLLGRPLSKREIGEIKIMDKNIAQIAIKYQAALSYKINSLTNILENDGVVAKDISGLKSKSGKPFVIVYNDPYCMATAHDKDDTPRYKSLTDERAYLCKTALGDGCGWIKGMPLQEKYDDIGVLCGSAGYIYKCQICGCKIGEFTTRRS